MPICQQRPLCRVHFGAVLTELGPLGSYSGGKVLEPQGAAVLRGLHFMYACHASLSRCMCGNADSGSLFFVFRFRPGGLSLHLAIETEYEDESED